MNLNEIKAYCNKFAGVSESFPFGDDVLVFKVDKKIFAIVNILSNPLKISLKCDPEFAVDLRNTYKEITPGYHLNKKHWNTIISNQNFPDNKIFDLISHSYDLVFGSLTKAIQKKINNT